jgi:hypothetical protein
MATMTGTTEQKIAGIPAGKTFSNRKDETFIQVSRALGASGGYVISCGWVVPEAHDDDYGSFPVHPFKTRTPRPWVGRQIAADTVTEAARIYDEWNMLLNGHGRPENGERIGSVTR